MLSANAAEVMDLSQDFPYHSLASEIYNSINHPLILMQ